MRLPAGLVIAVLVCVAAPSRAWPPGSERPVVAFGVGPSGERMVDEITSPVRWSGNAVRWALDCELPRGDRTLLFAFRYSMTDIALADADPASFDPGIPILTDDFDHMHDEMVDALFGLRWPWRRGERWRLDAGVGLRLRVETHGSTRNWNETTGWGGVALEPQVRVGWRPGPALDLGCTLGVPVAAWVLRSPYAVGAYDWHWIHEMRVVTVDAFRQVRLELVVRRALAGRVAAMAAGDLEYTWLDLHRPYRSVHVAARAGLAVRL